MKYSSLTICFIISSTILNCFQDIRNWGAKYSRDISTDSNIDTLGVNIPKLNKLRVSSEKLV